MVSEESRREVMVALNTWFNGSIKQHLGAALSPAHSIHQHGLGAGLAHACSSTSGSKTTGFEENQARLQEYELQAICQQAKKIGPYPFYLPVWT